MKMQLVVTAVKLSPTKWHPSADTIRLVTFEA